MKIGHILLIRQEDEAVRSFRTVVKGLDNLGYRQHIVVADDTLARTLQHYPFIAGITTTSSPVIANCMMANVDIVHAHDTLGGAAGLLMTLTRGIPYVMSVSGSTVTHELRPLQRAIRRRARLIVPAGNTRIDKLVELYAEALRGESELPEDSDGG